MLRRPLLGLVVLLVTVAGQPLARTVNRVVLNVGGDWAFWGFVLMGLAGAVLVAAALKWGELEASVAGYTGAMLMWHGLAEGCLRFFADQFQVPAVDFGGFPLDGGLSFRTCLGLRAGLRPPLSGIVNSPLVTCMGHANLVAWPFLWLR